MNTFQEKFTIEQALDIQRNQLIIWQPKLSFHCFQDLCAYVERENEKLLKIDNPNPYDVVRGDNLYMFIANWKPV